MGDIFGVIADPTRRDLLRVLLDRSHDTDSDHGDISVGELVEKLGLSQPTVSKHLRVLRDAGLVAVREVGQHRYYRLEPAPLEAVEDWLAPFFADEPSARRTAGAFSAWSGASIPPPLRRASESLQQPLRRVGETLQQPGEAGTAVGRAFADATHGARHRLEEASENLERRVIDPLKKTLKKD